LWSLEAFSDVYCLLHVPSEPFQLSEFAGNIQKLQWPAFVFDGTSRTRTVDVSALSVACDEVASAAVTTTWMPLQRWRNKNSRKRPVWE